MKMNSLSPHLNSMKDVEIFNPYQVKMDYVYLLQPLYFQLKYPCIISDNMPVVSLLEFVSIYDCPPDIDALLSSKSASPALRVYGCKVDEEGYLHDLDSHEKVLLYEQIGNLLRQTDISFIVKQENN